MQQKGGITKMCSLNKVRQKTPWRGAKLGAGLSAPGALCCLFGDKMVFSSTPLGLWRRLIDDAG